MSETNQSPITRETDGHVFLIGVHREAKMNAFTWEMLLDLSRAFSEYEENDDFRCAVVYAAGEHFSAGLDLADVAPHVSMGKFFPDFDTFFVKTLIY